MKKNLDWEIEFSNFIDENKNKPFAWGSWDCILMSNAMLKAMTGESLLPKSWKNWKTQEQAYKAIDKLSNGKGLAAGIENAMKKKKNWSKIEPPYATKGDVIVFQLIDGDGDSISAIHDGNGALCVEESGLHCKQDIKITHAWRLNG